MSTKYWLSAVGSATLLVTSAAAMAVHPGGQRGAEFDYATVEHVQPLTRIVRIPAEREECWEEPVTYYTAPHQAGYYSYTPTIVGGIIGAVVGNQFGRGSGKNWATVAGTALGASAGRDYANRPMNQRGYRHTSTEQRCRIVHDYHEQEQADGYRVTYSYNGRQYVTQTRTHPGQQLRVKVDVAPAEY